jgi:glutaconate CoA-transferase subunit B
MTMPVAHGVISSSQYSVAELMVCEISRWLTNGDVAVVWDDSPLGVAAARLAQLTHAPDLDFLLMPIGALNPAVEPMVCPLTDYAYLVAESVMPWEQATAVLARGVDLTVAEIEGIDAHGDIVSSLRELKPAAFPWLTTAKRVVLYSLKAELWHGDLKVTLVPSAHGGKLGYRLWRVINPLGAFEPAGRSRALRVRSIHPGITMDDVVDRCGLRPAVSEGLFTTLPPTQRELELLRRQIDPNGVLRDMGAA